MPPADLTGRGMDDYPSVAKAVYQVSRASAGSLGPESGIMTVIRIIVPVNRISTSAGELAFPI